MMMMGSEKVSAKSTVLTGSNDNRPARDGEGLEIPDGYYRSVIFPGMVFRKRQFGGCVPAEPGSHIKVVARRHVARIMSGTFQSFEYTDAASWALGHRLGFSGHPYRGNTRYAQDDAGKLIPDDDDGTGFQTIPQPEDQPQSRISTPEERAAARERVKDKAEAERRAIAKMRRKIDKRQNIGDPDCEPCGNEDFPLLAVLRKDRRTDLIAAVMKYRQLVALCESEPLKGAGFEMGRMAVEYETAKMKGVQEVEAAAKAGFPGDRVGGGEIKYRGIRKSDGAYPLPPMRKLPASGKYDGDPIVGRTASLHIKLTEDTLPDYIDSQPTLASIRARLGGMLDAIEDVALGGKTLTWVGEQHGIFGRDAAAAGKGIVYAGLAILDGFFGYGAHKPEPRKIKADNDNILKSNAKAA